jgi:hypothetical protein
MVWTPSGTTDLVGSAARATAAMPLSAGGLNGPHSLAFAMNATMQARSTRAMKVTLVTRHPNPPSEGPVLFVGWVVAFAKGHLLLARVTS